MAKILSFDELTKHNSRSDCWLLIHGKIYDLTQFLHEHPGGDEVLLAATEKDATVDFEDVGHSDNARELMKKYCIGELDQNTFPAIKKYNPPAIAAKKAGELNESVIKLLKLCLPLLVLALAFGLRYLF